ncbi:MAG: peptidylprolyl isomerase [Bdellovibrionota bacterium]|nr:peptidylprolyl isomerase [Bdellovibrionota bacterium]
MQQIQNDHVVEINFTLTNGNNEVLDSTEKTAPLAYIQGKGNIIAGLEKEILGKAVGDKFKVSLKAEEAYGLHQEDLIQAVPKENFGKEAENIQVGMQFQVQNPDGQVLVVMATEIRENEVVLDGNHPLAGMDLTFDVEVASIRQATPEELKRGNLQEEKSSCGCC